VEQVIHVFHGFLGTPADFSFLHGDDVKLYDLYTMESFPQIDPDDVLIGYSLGGRIALEIAEANQYQVKKIVLINSHPGLVSDEKRAKRCEFENSILEKFKLPMPEFINWWNALPLFRFDTPVKLNDNERYQKSRELFDRYRLSNQKYHLPNILPHREKFLWIIGLQDEQYMTMAKEELIPNDIQVKYLDGGHRLFQNNVVLKKLLQDECLL
jgi:2-succinyl-6-hydroxy-2,4-cyclohexadiene-1-carboxylate synthase